MDDIESINVLKNGNCCYRTRAANGVIVSPLKSTAGKTRVTYNRSITIGMRRN
ncbi:MAG: hypothetical protein ACLUDU_00445 [Butyricimonas faecihominis]